MLTNIQSIPITIEFSLPMHIIYKFSIEVSLPMLTLQLFPLMVKLAIPVHPLNIKFILIYTNSTHDFIKQTSYVL